MRSCNATRTRRPPTTRSTTEDYAPPPTKRLRGTSDTPRPQAYVPNKAAVAADYRDDQRMLRDVSLRD
jgi:hypothetical protein